MSRYTRIFGIGPVLLLGGIILIIITFIVSEWITFIFSIDEVIRYGLIIIFSFIMLMGIIYSIRSLPVEERGKKLITSDAFSLVRHPLYSSILIFFPIILVLITKDLIFVFTGIIEMILAHWLLKFEEKSILEYFGDEFVKYQNEVPMLIPYKGKN